MAHVGLGHSGAPWHPGSCPECVVSFTYYHPPSVSTFLPALWPHKVSRHCGGRRGFPRSWSKGVGGRLGSERS